MKYKFEKSKYPIFKIAFWVLITCSLILFLMIAKNNAYFLKLNNYSPILKPITLNIEFSEKVNDKIFVCFDDYCKLVKTNSIMAENKGFSFISSTNYSVNDENFYKTKIKKTYLALPKAMKNPESKIKNIDLYISNEGRYYNFSDIKKMENKIVPIIDDNTNKTVDYIVYAFDNSGNYIGLKNHLLIMGLSFVKEFKLYIFPYCWLFIAGLIFLCSKDAFKFSSKVKFSFFGFVILFYVLIMFVFSLLAPKENCALSDFILNDIKKYSKPYNVHIIAKNHMRFSKELKNIDAKWRYIVFKDEKINKIEKEEFVKDNEKTIIYFDSNSTNIGVIALMHLRAKIYMTNDGALGKIIYN